MPHPRLPAAATAAATATAAPVVAAVAATVAAVGALLGTTLTVLRAAPGLQVLPGAGLVGSFAAYGLVVWLVVAGLAWIGLGSRARRVAAPLALALAGLHAAWLAPYYVADDRPLTGPTVTILSVNVLGGATDPDALTRAAAGADVVVLLEYDRSTDAALAARDWGRRFPYRVGGPAPDAVGSVVFARRPLREVATLDTRFVTYLLEVDPGRPGAFGLLAGHPVNPPISRTGWVHEATLLTTAARGYAGPRLVVIGDLNSTPDHVTIRRMRAAADLRDAFDEAGAGWPRTYPANRRLIPPLLGLDQALLRGGVYAVSATTVRVPGSDHLGIRVVLALG
jgi:endonuclease/exonuclease/phosphatase (EEP) superfamily protein YafD